MSLPFETFLEQALKSAAYHEAGHTVAAASLRLPLREAGLHVDSRCCGVTLICCRNPGDPRNTAEDIRERERTISMLYAGYVAQRKFFSDCPRDGAFKDEATADALLTEMFHWERNPAWSATEQGLRNVAQKIVEERWDAIQALAETLWSKEPVSRFDLGPESQWSRDAQERYMTGTEVSKFLKPFQILIQITPDSDNRA
jgi:hypothetical protein